MLNEVNIDVWDFDKTIYSKDASFEFWKYCLKKKLFIIKYFPIQILYLILAKLHITSTKKFKEMFFLFVKGITKHELLNLLDDFWKHELLFMNQEIIETLQVSKLKKVCISASPEFLLEIPCQILNIDILIATNYSLDNFQIMGENCKGNEKVIRLKSILPNCKVNNFYSDSYSDKPLFDMAENKHLINHNGEIIQYDK